MSVSSTAVKLKHNGKPFDPNPLSPRLFKLKAHLDSCPTDELFDRTQIAKAIGSSSQYVDDMSRHEALAGYSQIVSRTKYFGHPKAIAELRRQVGA